MVTRPASVVVRRVVIKVTNKVICESLRASNDPLVDRNVFKLVTA